MSTLPDATAAGQVLLLDHSKDTRATKQWAAVPLVEADVPAIVQAGSPTRRRPGTLRRTAFRH